ncbi:acetyl/propionyl/methylcrotonyl-CoA carboxylase subunit alpha [Solicola gregarius]|uniref:acetyl/propionyl/methylcrotonyl-CoA carboxylase subunit alpha n=1 Tax=Solicola gregarius TaxID=2908642 RepID=UPI002FE0D383
MLVANRGEIARRVMHTCRTLGIETVAVFSDADTDAPFVVEADIAVRLPGEAAADTYLRGDRIVDAAKSSGADAIHPGYGFLSENAEFAQAVLDAGLTWIGPDPKTIEQMGSKVRAKEIMSAAGVPVLTAESGRYPMLVKASAGGGGRGMRVVDGPAELDSAIAAAEAEAEAAFGDGTVFVEPYLPTARHIEVQVLADRHGTCWVLGERDCSIQRRHQKVVEETPAPGISDDVRTRLRDAARAAVAAVDYVGAGTVEFLVKDEVVSFLEMNTRLQVEHPVTECVWGVDLVELQIAVAEDRALSSRFGPKGPVSSGETGRSGPNLGDGHAIEVRVYAEDPADDWRAQTGTVRAFEFAADTRFEVPRSYGVRVDSAVEPGSEIGIHYDPMLAKVVAWAPDRGQTIRMLRGALRHARVHGVRTNLELLGAILSDDDFVTGRVHTRLLDDRLEQWTEPRRSSGELHRYAVAAALVQAHSAHGAARVQSRIPAAYRNVPSQSRTRTYVIGDESIEIAYASERGRFVVDGVEVVHVDEHGVRLRHNGVRESYDVTVDGDAVYVDGPTGPLDLRTVPRFTDPAETVAEGSLLAATPASVAVVAVATGDEVQKGQTVVVLEAMKMQHTVSAPTDGVVAAIEVAAEQQVEAGAVLAVIDEHVPEGERT